MSKRATDSPLPQSISPKKQKIRDANLDTDPASSLKNVPEDASRATTTTENEEDIPAATLDSQDTKDEYSDIEHSVGASTSKKIKKKQQPPVGDGFDDFRRDIDIPPVNPFWGIKPLPGSPRPDPVQPSARESNGQTNPPLWEDRGYRYKRGSRYVKYFGPIAPDNVDELEENLDQEDLLIVKMIDMRPKSRKDPTPKRMPMIYCYGKVPRDWNNMQTLKALNDRRYQAIDRTTMDAPWTRIEREYLASLLQEDPDASIWDLTERHNDRFMNKDFTGETGFDFGNLSTGRTVESVRYEYTTFKPLYDKGKVPGMVRWRGDQSPEAKAIRASGRAERAFGPPSRVLQMAHDAENGGAEDDEDEGNDGDDEDEEAPETSTTKQSKFPKRSNSRHDAFPGQNRLGDDEEMLLELAGAYDSEIPESPSPDEPTIPAAEDESGFSQAAEDHDRLKALGKQSGCAHTPTSSFLE
ncbi:hypothetical protein ACJQWK_03092 [Exserohilum turcicum]